MRILQRLLWPLLAPLRGLRALCQLPSQLRQWQMTVEEHTAVIRETNDLFRELLIAIGQGPSQTPETPRLRSVAPPSSNPSSGPEPPSSPLQSVPQEPPNPKRLRTARDVTYSSRSYLREQDARVVAEQAPWRTPGA
jgi:hypothetical protein